MMFGEMITRRCLLTLDGGKDSSRPHDAEADICSKESYL